MILPSRVEYRHQNKQEHDVPKHWLTTILGVVAAIVLLICALAQTTILNEQYMTNEIVNSSVSNQIQNDINSSLSSYGLDTNVISGQQTRKILKQVIHQVYQGKNVRVNVENIVDDNESRLSETLSSYGLPSAVINQLPTGSINEQISSVVNGRINNDQLHELETGITIARASTLAGLVVSVVVLLLIVIRNLFSRTIIRDFRWITFYSGVIFACFLIMIKPVIKSYSQDFASFANVIHEISANILKIGWQMVAVDIGLAIILFIISFFLGRRRS